MKTANSMQLYNTLNEVGARMLIILDSSKVAMNLERLQVYDHVILHLGDINGNLPSIHPSNPSHSSEIIAKKQLIRSAITTMMLKGLVTIKCTSSGFAYAANKITAGFIQMLSSDYYKRVRANTEVVCELFSGYSDSRLKKLVNNGLQNWSGEIERSYRVGGDCRE